METTYSNTNKKSSKMTINDILLKHPNKLEGTTQETLIIKVNDVGYRLEYVSSIIETLLKNEKMRDFKMEIKKW